VIASPPLPRRAPRNDGLIAGYEKLRQQVLGQPSGIAHGQGLALLMRSGIAGWMQSWAPCVVEVVAPLKERLGNDAIFPFEMHREVTMILAAMVLYGRQEAIA
jgi:hypothetical protein